MTLLLELNDRGIRCYKDGQCLQQSPGFAVVDKHQLLLGEDALAQARLQPLNTHSHFWSQLNTKPLANPHPQVRHHADLAYLHMQSIEHSLPFNFNGQDVIFCLPGDTSREQLSLLLGIAQQFKLNTIGLLDAALAALINNPLGRQQWHLEMQLHHSVLTRLELEPISKSRSKLKSKPGAGQASQLRRTHVEILPKQGWLDIQNHLLHYFTEAFVQQQRFNPRHGADTEQTLYDSLPGWLQASTQHESLQCQLGQHKIQLDAAALGAQLQECLAPLLHKIHTLDDMPLCFGDHFGKLVALLPGRRNTQVLTPQALADSYHQASKDLDQEAQKHPQGVRFITALPCKKTPSNTTQNNPSTATHILCRHTAYPLSGCHSLFNQADAPIQKGQQAGALAYINAGQITPVPRTNNAKTAQLNGRPLSEPTFLYQGDTINLDNNLSLTLIKVAH